MAADWETKAAERRQQLTNTIPEGWRLKSELINELQTPLEEHDNNVLELGICRHSGILSDKELAITESYSVSALLQALAGGTLTALEVTTAFCKRAAIGHQLLNCCTEILFDRALQRAAELDARRAAGEPLGALHGLPISVKDNVQVEGAGATLGLVGFFDDVSEQNSAVVDIILKNGAVIYCKTNVPQTMMTVDSHNNIFGRTLNPHNTSLSAGGSSGGEGAIVGFRGSPLGLGTDVGGSVRFPAACNGVYGFRPTVGRIPGGDLKICVDPGMRQIKSCIGPLANDIDALSLLMKVVIDARPWQLDPSVIDIPWRAVTVEAGRKLRIGVMPADPALPLHPPVRDAVERAAAQLTAAGHEVVRLQPSECMLWESIQAAFGLFSLDTTGQRIVEAAGEPPIPSRTSLYKGITFAPWTYLADAKGLEGLALLSALNKKRAEITGVWHATYTKHSLDAVIGPLMQHTAAPHDEFASSAYGTIFNLIDYPACVIPFGKATAKEGDTFEVKPGQYASEYKPAKSEGMPCTIQIVTPTMRDEECLAISKVIDTCLNK
ncbi:fatty-acid amide hydrolase [Cordyceps fumosorosea ARSEF 2679]|uniref:amidase n=1 Tax=Cordyceps fumosorosea (strain ARSEF 2679) TaxID=1081104 RepID=A0A167ZER9_CORFA|nr:fatty-acid amide hydrolase [Cordyceps fumosorosea ARSEF 2679]OAA67425.1 fatty-acid amide hydrolase [Cordyceps fumosorosea ARSEF 2679]